MTDRDALVKRLQRLYAQLGSTSKNYDGEAVADAITALENALKRISELELALQALDDVLDFDEPGSETKPWIFEDWSDLNEAFDKARSALLPNSLDGND